MQILLYENHAIWETVSIWYLKRNGHVAEIDMLFLYRVTKPVPAISKHGFRRFVRKNTLWKKWRKMPLSKEWIFTPRKRFFSDFCCNIIIQPVDLYIDKHIIDLYKAKREEEDISIDFIYIKPREYNEPIIKKGTITQYGKTDDFLIEERNIDVLNIQREEKNKVKIKN